MIGLTATFLVVTRGKIEIEGGLEMKGIFLHNFTLAEVLPAEKTNQKVALLGGSPVRSIYPPFSHSLSTSPTRNDTGETKQEVEVVSVDQDKGYVVEESI